MKEIDVDVLDMLDEQIKTQETLLKKVYQKQVELENTRYLTLM